MNDVVIALIADGAVVPIVLIAAWALLFKIPNSQKYRAYCRMLLAGLTAYALAKMIGSVYQPASQRPFEQMGLEAGASYLNNPGFPSDHVLFCTVIVLAVWFETRNVRLTIVLAVLTLLVALGRVLALVHSPLDVVGGAVIAVLGALWYLQRPLTSKPKLVKQWSKRSKDGRIS